MSHDRYSRSAGAVYSLQYHIVFCPQYRRKVLVGEIETALRALLLQKAQELGLGIKAMEVMPDHVHLFVSADPTDAPQRIVAQLKGFTSRVLREQCPTLRYRLPTLWSRSYFISSTGDVSAAAIQRYIESRKVGDHVAQGIPVQALPEQGASRRARGHAGNMPQAL